MTAAVTPASGRQRTRSPFRRAIAALAVAAVVVPTAVLTTAGPSAAQAAPTFTVTPKVDLDPAGDTVTVQGTGYPDDIGVYVRFCTAPTGALGTADGRMPASACNGQGTWATNEFTIAGTTPITEGAWTVDLAAIASFGTVDCSVAGSCGVSIRRDHNGSADFTYDSFTPVSFVAPPADVPTFTVTPSSGLDPAGDTVTVNGTGYSGDVGIYVRFCSAPTGEVGTAAGRRAAADCNGQGTWVTNSMAVPDTTPITGGAWTVDLEAIALVGGVDCTVADACGVAIRRDHNGGSTDFSYDSYTPVTFAAAPGEGPTYTVAPTSGLDAAGDTVEVDGSGYPADQGFYVRFCAAPTGTVGTAAGRPTADDCDGQGTWVTNQYTVPGTTPNNDGAWNLDLDVVGAFATASRAIDCTTAGSCGVFVRRDTGGATDYTLDSFTPLTFDATTTPPVVEPPVAPSLNTVELSLSKTTGLADGESVVASGAKYTPDDGIYAQYCAKPTGQLGTAAGRASQCYPGQDGIHTVWVTPIPANSTFSTPVKVEKSFELEDGTVIDCSADNACGVFTRRDHNGGGDYSQDAFVGVSFGDGTVPEPEAAALTADQTSGLTPEGDVVAVSGANFRPGVDYVVTLCEIDDPAACDFANATEVTSDTAARAVGDPGSFVVDLDVQAAFGTTDCLAPGTECAISTFAVSLSEPGDEVDLPVTFAAWSGNGTPGDAQGVSSDGSTGAVNGGVLPRTGSNTIPLVAGGFMAVLLGAGLVFGSRRSTTT